MCNHRIKSMWSIWVAAWRGDCRKMNGLNRYLFALKSMDIVSCILLVLFLLCLLVLAANLLWALWKWRDWKWCEWSADRSLFYRVCRMRYGIMDSRDLTSEENQRRVQEVAKGYKRFAHYSIERLGRILDRQRPKYEALRRN